MSGTGIGMNTTNIKHFLRLLNHFLRIELFSLHLFICQITSETNIKYINGFEAIEAFDSLSVPLSGWQTSLCLMLHSEDECTICTVVGNDSSRTLSFNECYFFNLLLNNLYLKNSNVTNLKVGISKSIKIQYSPCLNHNLCFYCSFGI